MIGFRHAALVVLLLTVPTYSGATDTPSCTSGPDTGKPFPTAAARLERAHEVWLASSPRWTSASTIPNGSLHYGFTFQYQDYLRLLFDSGAGARTDQVLAAMLDLMTRFQTQDRVKVYYPDGRTRLDEVKLSRPYAMLLSKDGKEEILAASQFIGMVAETLHRVARIAPAERSAIQSRFAAAAMPLALDHIRRWTSERPGAWTQIGLGCKGYGETVTDYMSIAIRRGTRPDEPLYCRGLTGSELWTIYIAVELAAALRADRSMAEDAGIELGMLDRTIALGSDFLASKFHVTDVIDERGRRRQGMVVQPGDFSAHFDHAYAGYVGDAFPQPADQARVSGLSIDIPHAGRLVTLLFALAEDHPEPERRAEFAAWRERLANQLAYIVFNGNLDAPRFRNFLDGSNGWYRVNHEGRDGFGFPPYSAGLAWLYMPFMRLAPFHTRIAAIGDAVWRVLQATGGPACEAGRSAFGTYQYRNGKLQEPGVLQQDVTEFSFPFFVTMPTRN